MSACPDSTAVGRHFDVISLLRANCPLLAKESLGGVDLSELLHRLKQDTDKLVTYLASDGTASVGEVLKFVNDRGLASLNSKLVEYLSSVDAELTVDEIKSDAGDEEESLESQAMAAYFKCPAKQLWGYQSYIEDESPFFTQQGIKGTEFARVLTVIDEDEGSHPQFSYNKYFGLTLPSATDRKNQAEGKETVVDRTRRLFYVCCSRALQDLAVVVFTQDVQTAAKKIQEMSLFPPDQVHVFTGPPEGV
jgi:DNA helicase-2/ATP-dependent DNA helicase PcrA